MGVASVQSTGVPRTLAASSAQYARVVSENVTLADGNVVPLWLALNRDVALAYRACHFFDIAPDNYADYERYIARELTWETRADPLSTEAFNDLDIKISMRVDAYASSGQRAIDDAAEAHAFEVLHEADRLRNWFLQRLRDGIKLYWSGEWSEQPLLAGGLVWDGEGSRNPHPKVYERVDFSGYTIGEEDFGKWALVSSGKITVASVHAMLNAAVTAYELENPDAQERATSAANDVETPPRGLWTALGAVVFPWRWSRAA